MVGKGWLFDRLVGSLFVFFLIVVKGLDSPCTGSVDLRDNLASVLRQVPRLRYSENDISVGCKSSAGASPLPETAVVIISCGVSEHRLRFFRRSLGSISRSSLRNTKLYILENCEAEDPRHSKAAWAEIESFEHRDCSVVKLKTPKLGGVLPAVFVGIETALRTQTSLQRIALIEADVAVTPNWLQRIEEIYIRKRDGKEPVCMVSGYKARQHPEYDVKDNLKGVEREMVSLSGVNLMFGVDLYKAHFRQLLKRKMESNDIFGVDWHFSEYCSNTNRRMYATRPSVVQHIGIGYGLTQTNPNPKSEEYRRRIETLVAEWDTYDETDRGGELNAVDLERFVRGWPAPEYGKIHRRISLGLSKAGKNYEALDHYRKAVQQDGNKFLQELWGNFGLNYLHYYQQQRSTASTSGKLALIQAAYTCTKRALELNTETNERSVSDDFDGQQILDIVESNTKALNQASAISWRACRKLETQASDGVGGTCGTVPV